MPLIDYRNFVSAKMSAAVEDAGEYSLALKRLLTATELLANLRAKLTSASENAPLTRDEFTTATFLMQTAVNNLQKLPKAFMALDEASSLRSVLYTEDKTEGSTGLNYNFERNNTAHVLNLEYFATLHQESGIRKLWLSEFFGANKAFDQMLATLENFTIISATDKPSFTPVILVASSGSADGSGAASPSTSAGAAASAETSLEMYAPTLPKLIDASAGKGHRATETAFSGHQTALLQLLNYHLQLALQAQNSGSTTLKDLSIFSQSMQVIGNISKILHVIGGIPARIYDQLDLLTFVRNEIAHTKNVSKVLSYMHATHDAEYVAEALNSASTSIQEITEATLTITSDPQPVINVTGSDFNVAELIQNIPSSADDTLGASAAGAGAAAAAGGSNASRSRSTIDTTMDIEALDAAIADIHSRTALSIHDSDSDTEEDITGAGAGAASGAHEEGLKAKFETHKTEQVKLAKTVFQNVSELIKLHREISTLKSEGKIAETFPLLKAFKISKAALEQLLTDPNFDINTCVTVQHAAVNKIASDTRVSEEKDFETLTKMLSGETVLGSGEESTTILPLNALLILVKQTIFEGRGISSSPYCAIVRLLLQQNTLSMEYVKEMNAFTNPSLMQLSLNILGASYEYDVAFAETLCSKYAGALTHFKSQAFKYFDNTPYDVELLAIMTDNQKLFADLFALNDMGAEQTKWHLFNSSILGKINIIKFIIENGIDINSQSSQGTTPLHIAAMHGHLNCVKYLIENGSDITLVSDLGWTALHSAAYNGNSEIVELLATIIDPNIPAKDGNIALCMAVNAGQLEAVKLLVETAADINTKYNCFTLLDVACSQGHLDVAQYLIEHGADINCPNEKDGATILHRAILDGDKPEIIEFCITNDANQTLKTTEGLTPLMLATNINRSDIVQCLLDSGGVSRAVAGEALGYAFDKGLEKICRQIMDKMSEMPIQLSAAQLTAVNAALNGIEVINTGKEDEDLEDGAAAAAGSISSPATDTANPLLTAMTTDATTPVVGAVDPTGDDVV